MKLLKSSIFAALALAVTLTGCSDDDNYSSGQASPGVYFPQGLDSKVTSSTEASVYEVPVCRTSADDKSTYEVSYNIYPKTDAISIPSTVSFSGDAVNSTLPITYDAEALNQDDVYAIVINLSDASSYGDAAYSFSFQVSAPLVTELWDGTVGDIKGQCPGTGTWTFSQLDAEENYKIYKVYNPDKPHTYTLQITNWCNFLDDSYSGVPLSIEIEDDTQLDEYGTVTVRVPAVSLGTDIIGDGAATYVGDFYAATGNSKYANYSYFDPATGTLYLALAWYSSASGIVASGYDYLQLDGYPDYTISAAYKGLFKDTDDNFSAIGTISTGADVASVKAALVLTSDQQAAAEYVINGGSDVIDVTPGTDVYAQFPVSKSGSYLLTAVSYNSAGVPQNYACATAVIDLNSKDADDTEWKTLGTGQFADGWFLTAYGYDATDYLFDVTIRQSATDPTKYQIVEPYTTSENILVQYNTNSSTAKRNIVLTVDGDYVEMRPQLSGYLNTNMSTNELMIMNYEGYYAYVNDANGTSYTAADIQAQLTADGIDLSTCSSDEDGTLIEMPLSPFCKSGEVSPYHWRNSSGVSVTQSSYVILPGASAAARRKVSAKMIAAPKFTKLSTSIKVKAAKSNLVKNSLKRTKFTGQRHSVVR